MNIDHPESVLTIGLLQDIRRRLHAISPCAPPPSYYIYQYRFPKSKKKRIRNKWSADIRNYRNASLPGNPRFGKVDLDAPFLMERSNLDTIRKETNGFLISMP